MVLLPQTKSGLGKSGFQAGALPQGHGPAGPAFDRGGKEKNPDETLDMLKYCPFEG
jgi:hypothetical protein